MFLRPGVRDSGFHLGSPTWDKLYNLTEPIHLQIKVNNSCLFTRLSYGIKRANGFERALKTTKCYTKARDCYVNTGKGCDSVSALPSAADANNLRMT